MKYVKLYMDTLKLAPKNRIVANQPETEAAKNIFQTQEDVRDFLLIFARHLSSDVQPLEKKIISILEQDNIMTLDAGVDPSRLITRIHESLSAVMSDVQEAKIEEIVNGIMKQFKEVSNFPQSFSDEDLCP